MKRVLAAASSGFALAAAACPQAGPVPSERGPVELRPPRDGSVAIRQELAAARRAGTVAAYDLFLARHPDHPLTRTAQEERARLLEREKRK